MTIHIGQQIQDALKHRGMTVSEFGRRINKSRENVYSIFKRKTIDTGLLYTISQVLEQDFFILYSIAAEPGIENLKSNFKASKSKKTTSS